MIRFVEKTSFALTEKIPRVNRTHRTQWLIFDILTCLDDEQIDRQREIDA